MISTLGIDYQQTLLSICLREGSYQNACLRFISDGTQTLIPNLVHQEAQNQLWGSKALKSKEYSWLTKVSSCSGLSHPNSDIWNHIYRHLYNFLGRIAPTPENNYQLVVAPQAENHSQVAKNIERVCLTAGFKSATIISTPAAILSRWVAEYANSEIREKKIVVVVAVGDVSTTVGAYELYPNTQQSFPPFYLINASSQIYISNTGLAYWNAKLLSIVSTKLKNSITPEYNLGMRDAALEFARYLGKVDKHQLLNWNGPLKQKMYAPLDITRNHCEAWSEVSNLTLHLPKAIEQSLSAISSKQPDLILVGGAGAIYPFAKDTAARYGQVWQSPNPEQDIALGAASWPEVSSSWNNPHKQKQTALPQNQKLPEQPLAPSEPKSKLIPPWQRE